MNGWRIPRPKHGCTAAACWPPSEAAGVAIATRGAPVVRVLGLHLRAAARAGRRQIARLSPGSGLGSRRSACLDDRRWPRHRCRGDGRDRSERSGRQRSARESLHEIRLPQPSDSIPPRPPPARVEIPTGARTRIPGRLAAAHAIPGSSTHRGIAVVTTARARDATGLRTRQASEVDFIASSTAWS
jgi:hypothetical protein